MKGVGKVLWDAQVLTCRTGDVKKTASSRLVNLSEFDIPLRPDHEADKRADVPAPAKQQTISKPLPVPATAFPTFVGGKHFSARVATAGIDNRIDGILMKQMNTTLKDLSVEAAAGSVTIAFNWDSWTFGHSPQLLVRFFDEQGNYLTHFITKEKFTSLEHMAKATGAILLKNEKNSFTYGVSRTVLRDAAIVEVGFWLPLDTWRPR